MEVNHENPEQGEIRSRYRSAVPAVDVPGYALVMAWRPLVVIVESREQASA
jgi:hypothetical protein